MRFFLECVNKIATIVLKLDTIRSVSGIDLSGTRDGRTGFGDLENKGKAECRSGFNEAKRGMEARRRTPQTRLKPLINEAWRSLALDLLEWC
jgi:hypothetical protein